MTPADPDATELTPFLGRLLDGVYVSVSATRRLGHGEQDEAVLMSWLAEKFGPLGGLRDDQWNPRGEPFPTIERLAGELRRNRALLTAVVCSPQLVLCRLLVLCGSSQQGLVDCWVSMCWIAEAAWDALTGTVPPESGYATGDAGLLEAMAARTRFLVLTEPMRSRGRTGGSMWAAEQDVLGGNGVLDSAFGLDSWTDLVGRCRAARREWQGCLDSYQSHPLLRHARPADLEHEVRTLVFGDGRSRPLVLSVAPLAAPAALTPEDTATIADCADRHLLPRFAVETVARLALYDDSPVRRRSRVLFAALVAGTGLAAAGCAAALQVHAAVRLALACYALICVGVAVLPAGWGMMWLLRMPAASAVGVFALVAFLPGWLQAPPGGWVTGTVLLAVSYGYLLVEVRNHGVARTVAPPRALLVAVIGAVHALLVATIGLALLAPGLVPDGGKHTGTVLEVAAAWCLTIGVFSQILWDDRPITATLAHLSWRR